MVLTMSLEIRWDVIIIGGGLAGLTSGAYLAKAGKSVLLLEQQDLPGGCCGSCPAGEKNVPPAPHVVNYPGMVNGILNETGAGETRFFPLDPAFTVTGPCGDNELVITKDSGLFLASACGIAPGAEREEVQQGLARIMELSRQVHNETNALPHESPELMSFFKRLSLGISLQRKLPVSMEYGKVPVRQFLGSVFPGDAMKCLRSALRSVVPLRDARALDLLQLLGDVAENNLFYPSGGIESIIDSMSSCFQSHGGVLRTGSKVTAVHVSGRKVTGISLADGSTMECDVVLSTVDMKELFFNLLPENSSPSLFREKLGKIPLSDSFFTVTATTSLSPEAPVQGCPGPRVLNPALEEDAIFASDEPERVSLFIYTREPPLGDMTGARSVVQIMAPVRFTYADNWHSGPQYEKTEDYDKFRAQYADILIRRAAAVVPGLSSHILDIAVCTPVSYRSSTGNDEGAAYGWRRPRMWRQNVPYLHGLYIAGHWTFPGPGVLKTMMSGKNASRIILSGH